MTFSGIHSCRGRQAKARSRRCVSSPSTQLKVFRSERPPCPTQASRPAPSVPATPTVPTAMNRQIQNCVPPMLGRIQQTTSAWLPCSSVTPSRCMRVIVRTGGIVCFMIGRKGQFGWSGSRVVGLELALSQNLTLATHPFDVPPRSSAHL